MNYRGSVVFLRKAQNEPYLKCIIEANFMYVIRYKETK